MGKRHHSSTTINDLNYLSQTGFSAHWETRPAEDVLPPCALSTAEPREKGKVITLSSTPILLATEDAGEIHLTERCIHRPWQRHPRRNQRKPRQAPFAGRHHPKCPVHVLVVYEAELASYEQMEVLKFFYQYLKPAAEAVPGYSCDEVVKKFLNSPALSRAFANVVFNRPGETLSTAEIAALLCDVVSVDRVKRVYKKTEAALQPAPGTSAEAAAPAPADPEPDPEPEPEDDDPCADVAQDALWDEPEDKDEFEFDFELELEDEDEAESPPDPVNPPCHGDPAPDADLFYQGDGE